jgi:hypothetical protein
MNPPWGVDLASDDLPCRLFQMSVTVSFGCAIDVRNNSL